MSDCQIHFNVLNINFINVENNWFLIRFVWRKLTTETSYSHQQSPFRPYFFLQGYQRSSSNHAKARTGRPILVWFFLPHQRPPPQHTSFSNPPLSHSFSSGFFFPLSPYRFPFPELQLQPDYLAGAPGLLSPSPRASRDQPQFLEYRSDHVMGSPV